MRDDVLEVSGLPNIFEIALLWASDRAPSFPASGAPEPCDRYFPSAPGFRFAAVTIPPAPLAREAQAALKPASATAAMSDIEGRVGAGLFASLEPDHPGMHTSDTVDCGVVLQGEVWLELDDGQEICLAAGDTFVQNGTRHRWSNRGSQIALMAVVLIGGAPRA